MRGTWWPEGEPFVWPRHYPPQRIPVIERLCTQKEVEVLKLKAHGFGRRRIATMLGISESAVRARKRSARAKLQGVLEELEEVA